MQNDFFDRLTREFEIGSTVWIYDKYMRNRRPAVVLEKVDLSKYGYNNIPQNWLVEFSCHVDSWVNMVTSPKMFLSKDE